MSMIDLSLTGLYTLIYAAVEEHGAADAWCCSVRCTAVGLHLCASERPELWHLLRTYDEGSAGSSLRDCSDVCVR